MDGQARYEYYKQLHPDWSEEQLWTAVSIDEQAKKTVKEGGEDIDIFDSEIINRILVKARAWLADVLPVIFNRVKRFFDDILTSIASWAQRGLQYVIDLIGSILG